MPKDQPKSKPRSPQSCIAEARRIAHKHGMYVVTRSDCWLIYRNNPNAPTKGTLIGKRTSPHQVLTLVHQCSQTKGA